MESKYEFWNDTLPEGFYDDIFIKGLNKKAGLQSSWHHLTFVKIKKYILKNDNHLDYACGPGTFIGKYLNTKSLGYDISKNQIDYANSKYSNKFKNFSISKKDVIKNGPYDVITVIGLIEFLNYKDINKEINFLLDNLTGSGKIIFTTPNYGGLMYLIEKISNIFNEVSYKEVKESNFSKTKLLNLLKSFDELNKCNYKVKRILNFGILFTILNKNTGIKIENFIEKIFRNYFGFLLVLEISKK